MSVLRLFNRQKTRGIALPFLRKISQCLLGQLLDLKSYELAIHLIGPSEMTKLNETFLRHEGSTDVITFDNTEPGQKHDLAGEIFISVDDAISYARQFRTSWQSEVTRYVVHGVLHLRGYDDLEPALRTIMKREENRLVKVLAQRFDLTMLAKEK
jgi:probable rRNA maturation factor